MLGGYPYTFPYAFVGATADALRLWPAGFPSDDLIAWHPDDEEHWFFTKQACLEAAERATDAIRRDPEAQPPGGIHFDCVDNYLVPN